VSSRSSSGRRKLVAAPATARGVEPATLFLFEGRLRRAPSADCCLLPVLLLSAPVQILRRLTVVVKPQPTVRRSRHLRHFGAANAVVAAAAASQLHRLPRPRRHRVTSTPSPRTRCLRVTQTLLARPHSFASSSPAPYWCDRNLHTVAGVVLAVTGKAVAE